MGQVVRVLLATDLAAEGARAAAGFPMEDPTEIGAVVVANPTGDLSGSEIRDAQ